jgi:hypothetical protein
MKLYTYYRSQASFRVRIGLNLKGIAREDSYLHLEKGDQFAAAYQRSIPFSAHHSRKADRVRSRLAAGGKRIRTFSPARSLASKHLL